MNSRTKTKNIKDTYEKIQIVNYNNNLHIVYMFIYYGLELLIKINMKKSIAIFVSIWLFLGSCSIWWNPTVWNSNIKTSWIKKQSNNWKNLAKNRNWTKVNTTTWAS